MVNDSNKHDQLELEYSKYLISAETMYLLGIKLQHDKIRKTADFFFRVRKYGRIIVVFYHRQQMNE